MLSNNISNHQKKYLIKSSKNWETSIIGFPFLLNHRKSNTNFNKNMTKKSYCAFCKQPYKKQHPNQRYCSKECSEEARRLKSRIYFSRWYNKNRIYCYTRKKGTGHIGAHKHPDDNKEYETIQTELRRLGLRK